MDLLKYFLFNPFIAGIFSGIIVGNMSLGIITVSFAVLLWGYKKLDTVYIVLVTVLIVIFSGNINFELPLIFSLTSVYLLNNDSFVARLNLIQIKKYNRYLISAFISLLLLPFWRLMLGIIPVRLLNEINIAGSTILLSGIILSWQRGMLIISENRLKALPFIKFITVFLLAAIGMTGEWIIIPFWIVGLFLLLWLKNYRKNIFIYPEIQYFFLSVIAAASIYFLVPLQFIIIILLIAFIIFLYFSSQKIPVLEILYLAFFLGVLAGRLGLLL